MQQQSTAGFGVAVGFTGDQVVLSVSGDLDIATASELELVLGAVVDAGRGRVVLDLANVAFIGGAALEPIAAAAERLRARGSRLELRSVPFMGRRLLELTGLEAAAEAPAAAPVEMLRFTPSLTVLPAEELVAAGMQLVADLARTTIAHLEGAGVSLRRDGHLRTVAVSDAAVEAWDDQQHADGDGPCIEASVAGRPQHVAQGGDDRWTGFMGRMRDAGITSILSMPVLTGPDVEPLGSLNLYSHRSDGFTRADYEVATRLAAHAAGMVERVRAAEAVDLFGERFEEVLVVRDAVAQAQGMLMDRSGTSPEGAFEALRRFAKHSGSPLTDVAREMVDATYHSMEIDLR